MEDESRLDALTARPYVPGPMERLESAIVHLLPWVNIIIPGFIGLPLAVMGWSFRRHSAPWTSHACKQVIVWQLLSLPFFLIGVVFVGHWISTPESGYAVPALLHPFLGEVISLGQLILLPFALVSTYGAVRSPMGYLFRYPIVGDLIKPPTTADRREPW